MKNEMTKRITRMAIVAAIYCVLTMILAPLSFGPIQFRVSEVLVLLAVLDPMYIIGLSLGCFLSNLLGGFGLMDMFFGTLATAISCALMYVTYKKIPNTKGLIVSSLWATIFNGLIIGWMLYMVIGAPLLLTMAQVAIGEFVVVTILGVPFTKIVIGKIGNKIFVH